MGTDGQSEVTEESPSAGERVADNTRDIAECADKRRREMRAGGFSCRFVSRYERQIERND